MSQVSSRRHPTHTKFLRPFQRLRETGQLKSQCWDRGGKRAVRTPGVEEAAIDRVAEESSIRTRLFAHELGVAQITVGKVRQD